tara:strand:- start:3108 stop:3746 length:639 start_codon:yes stop_codon:yes gene_type:complete
MLLIERVPNEQLYLLIIMIISFILISHSIKNRPNLIKSIVLAHIKKTDFKFVLNNIQDRTTSILFLNSISLQALAICFFFEEKNFSSSQIIIALISAVIIKRALIKISGKIFQKKKLSEIYLTSFTVMAIQIGWASAVFSFYKIIYHNSTNQNLFNYITTIFFIIVVFYLLSRFIILLTAAKKEEVSFLHIIFYLCTLEILPLALILIFISR